MSDGRQVLRGIAASPGVAVGRATVFDRVNAPVPRREGLSDAEVEAERERLRRAIADARAEVERARDALDPAAHADRRLLLETQALMLGDALLLEGADDALRSRRINAEWALRRTTDTLAGRLEASPEPYFRMRAADVRHVGEHILRVLTGAETGLPELLGPTVLVANDLSPAEAAQLPGDRVLALVTGSGSASGHTAILARALRIPAVVGVSEVTQAAVAGETVVVDALRGEVVLDPTPSSLAEAQERASRFAAFGARLREAERSATSTHCGTMLRVQANVELDQEVALARREGAEGIGLYRTEFLYLGREREPSEAEQTAAYRRVLARMAPHEVTFRTFDLGGDKMPRGGFSKGPNPALGVRALRVAFERPEMLVTQLRAMLRASEQGRLRMLFPMVTGVADLRRASALLARAREDLDLEGVAYGPVPVGCMLEIPSAVLMAERLAPHVDFFSVGTNDLTQYTLAVDRSDPRVAHLGRALDPAVLRLLRLAHDAAKATETRIGICGEMAADPVAVPVLLGLGYRELSVPTVDLPLVREAVSRLTLSSCEELAQDCLGQDSAMGVERCVMAHVGEELADLWDEQGLELPR